MLAMIMTMLKVESSGDKTIISDNIPQDETSIIEYALATLIMVALFCTPVKMIYKEALFGSIFEVATMTSVFFLTLTVGGVLHRILNFVTECQLIKSHYDNKWSNVAAATCDFSDISKMLVIISLIFSVIYAIREGNPINVTWVHGGWPCLTTLVLASFLYNFIESKGTNHVTAQTIRSMKGVDYGSGMAFSYFYGYLRIILPGIRKKMDIYEARENVSIPVKKLFILIPKSGHLPPDLCDASNQWLEASKHLEQEIIDRAGVKSRSYKNTVYKIHRGGMGNNTHRPIYLTTEGATPMLTFWEILRHNHKQTSTFRQNRMQIVHSFYKTLYELIDNDPDCRDVCELIFYEDYESHKKKVNVAEMLLQKICGETPTVC